MSDGEQVSREGARFGPYTLRHLIGSGATGEVYEAHDVVNDKVVALKLVRSSLRDDTAFRDRMGHELLVIERLDEPHVLPINDHGEIDDELYIDTRLIEGGDLAALLRQDRSVEPARAVAIVGGVAAALDAAHAAGVVHCDVKPHDILLGEDDFAYLGDFGISDSVAVDAETPAEAVVERLRYTAPERFADIDANHQVDVYSLACVLYECLTGFPPYRADDVENLVNAHLCGPIPRPSQLRPSVPTGFDEVIARGMAKDPRERFLTSGELAAAALEALTQPSHQVDTRSDGSGEPSTPPRPAQQVRSDPPARPVPIPPPPGPYGSAPHHPLDPAGRRPGGEFSLPPYVFHRPRKWPSRRLLLGAGAAAVAVTLGIVGLTLSSGSSEAPPKATPTSAPTSSTTSAPPAAESQARLLGLLPAGYPPGACKPSDPPKGALAAVFCDQNIDPDGPSSAAYTLYPDSATLTSAFNRLVQLSAVVVCPGRIQSPGPWHHVANPDEPGGMVLCATTQGNPTIGWTNDGQLVVSVVQSPPQGPGLDALFAWWSSHS